LETYSKYLTLYAPYAEIQMDYKFTYSPSEGANTGISLYGNKEHLTSVRNLSDPAKYAKEVIDDYLIRKNMNNREEHNIIQKIENSNKLSTSDEKLDLWKEIQDVSDS